ncbi:MAG: hypothetical protein Q9160_006199 [Pyrenula sp. 1 TL-2023]
MSGPSLLVLTRNINWDIFKQPIGSGVYLSPASVLAAVGSKDIDKVWTRKSRLFTYIFASLFVVANGSHNNALIFAQQVLFASSGTNSSLDPRLVKFLAIVITTFVCQILAFSRSAYIKISYVIIVIKIFVLCFIAIVGLISFTGARRHSPDMINTPYGLTNLHSDFSKRKADPYSYSLAMLNIMRAYLGYENANFILTEVKTGPDADERRTYRRAAKVAVATLCVLYFLVNIAFFSVCTTDEIIDGSETLVTFFEKVFGPSEGATLATCIIIMISAIGALMSLTYANVRVKQEIGRIGLLPYPEFWAKTSHHRVPAGALVLHWIFTVLFIIIAPLNLANGFSFITTFYSYAHTYISIALGSALLCAPWLSSFRHTDREDGRFKVQSSRFGYWLLGPLAMIYTVTNAGVLVLSWFPVNEQQVLHTTLSTLPWWVEPVAVVCLIAIGVLWWYWDRIALPKMGYIFHVEEDQQSFDRRGASVVQVDFCRELQDPALSWWRFILPAVNKFRRLCQGEETSTEDEQLIGITETNSAYNSYGESQSR